MKKTLIFTLATASFCSAATLDDFTDFVGSPTQLAYFATTWSNDPDGAQTPLASFSQGSGIFSFSGGTNIDSAYVDKYLSTDFGNVSFPQINTLTLTAKLLANNAAPSFVITLYDADGKQATASFTTSQFNSTNFTSQSAALTSTNGFNFTTVNIQFYRFTGDTPLGSAQLNIAFDNIDVSFQAVPEPTTFACLVGLSAIGIYGTRRRRRIVSA